MRLDLDPVLDLENAELRAALAGAADRQGPTVIEIDELQWQQSIGL